VTPGIVIAGTQTSYSQRAGALFAAGLWGPSFGPIVSKQTTGLPGGNFVTDFIEPGAMA